MTLDCIDGYATTPVSDFYNGLILTYYNTCTCPPHHQYFELKLRGQETAGEIGAFILLQFCRLMPSFSRFTLHISSHDVLR